jgi:hypothetical protein
MHSSDPLESAVAKALDKAGIRYIHEHDAANAWPYLDFYLPDHDLFIEVARCYTPRKIEQLSRVDNVIFIQGLEAAEAFAAMISR